MGATETSRATYYNLLLVLSYIYYMEPRLKLVRPRMY